MSTAKEALFLARLRVAPISQRSHVATLGRAFATLALHNHSSAFSAVCNAQTLRELQLPPRRILQDAVGAKGGTYDRNLGPRATDLSLECHSPQNSQRQIMRFGASRINPHDEEGKSPGMARPRFTARFQMHLSIQTLPPHALMFTPLHAVTIEYSLQNSYASRPAVEGREGSNSLKPVHIIFS